ncbi:hypothetical protein [uncultured Roseibium sp.]|uniref:hypothetical protein n=1 Tax=uncultured Roseibium sp. TaxID=1936171 RepID=UPI003217D35A
MPTRRTWRRQPSSLRPVLALAFAGAMVICSPPAAAAESVLTQKGLALSQLHCARCHIVSDKDRFSGISSTPSFKIMIEVLKDWEDRFQTFMARNPHPAHIRLETDDPRPENLPVTTHEVILSLDDIEAILAYVEDMAAHMGKSGN